MGPDAERAVAEAISRAVKQLLDEPIAPSVASGPRHFITLDARLLDPWLRAALIQLNVDLAEVDAVALDDARGVIVVNKRASLDRVEVTLGFAPTPAVGPRDVADLTDNEVIDGVLRAHGFDGFDAESDESIAEIADVLGVVDDPVTIDDLSQRLSEIATDGRLEAQGRYGLRPSYAEMAKRLVGRSEAEIAALLGGAGGQRPETVRDVDAPASGTVGFYTFTPEKI